MIKTLARTTEPGAQNRTRSQSVSKGGNLLIVRSDPGDDLDPSLMHSLESLSLLLGILVWDGSDEVVTLAVLVDLVGMWSDDDLVDQQFRERAPILCRQILPRQ